MRSCDTSASSSASDSDNPGLSTIRVESPAWVRKVRSMEGCDKAFSQNPAWPRRRARADRVCTPLWPRRDAKKPLQKDAMLLARCRERSTRGPHKEALSTAEPGCIKVKDVLNGDVKLL